MKKESALKLLLTLAALIIPCGASAQGPMYNTPDTVQKIMQIVGKCDTDESYVVVYFKSGEQRTPIQCQYGVMMELPNNNYLINFAYDNAVISFGGVYNTDDKTIDVDQFWPGPSPVEAVNRVTVNGLIDKNLIDAKCFHLPSFVHCGLAYRDDNNSFLYSLKITYKKLIDITTEVKKLRKRN